MEDELPQEIKDLIKRLTEGDGTSIEELRDRIEAELRESGDANIIEDSHTVKRFIEEHGQSDHVQDVAKQFATQVAVEGLSLDEALVEELGTMAIDYVNEHCETSGAKLALLSTIVHSMVKNMMVIAEGSSHKGIEVIEGLRTHFGLTVESSAIEHIVSSGQTHLYGGTLNLNHEEMEVDVEAAMAQLNSLFAKG